MAVEVVMPRFGWNMETGRLVEWRKQDGDAVQVGDILCTIEGDKAVEEVEAEHTGTLRIPPGAPAPGTDVPVGTVLAYLLQPGEPAPFARPAPSATVPTAAIGGAQPRAAATSSAAEGPVPTTEHVRRYAEPTISPRARRVAVELGVDWTMVRGSGRTGRIVERDVRETAAQRAPAPPARMSSVARRMAEEAGIDLAALASTQPGKRITRADVEGVARIATELTEAPASQTVPMSGVRRIIAERMAASAHTSAPVTLTTEADATTLVRLREQIKTDYAGSGLPIPSYTDLFAKLVAVALREHPALNASLEGEGIVHHDVVHIGIAVDTERGLLVPVVRDVLEKSMQRIATDSARLIAEARSGQIAAADLRGSTFTVTNLGMYEIDAFTPIVNLPECAILGLGRIVARPVVDDEASEQVAVRKMMALSLTFDHRLVDGGPAAGFLQRVKQFVEHPTLWVI